MNERDATHGAREDDTLRSDADVRRCVAQRDDPRGQRRNRDVTVPPPRCEYGCLRVGAGLRRHLYSTPALAAASGSIFLSVLVAAWRR